MADERPRVLDYHVPEKSSSIGKWLRRLPRPSLLTWVVLILTAAAAVWVRTDSVPWTVVRTFDGAMTWHGLSANGKRILIVPTNGQTIRVCDIATGKAIRDLHRPTGGVRTAAFSPDSQRVWSIGDGSDDTAYLWDVASGHLLASQKSRMPPFGFDWLGVNYASPFSPDGRWIAAGQDNGLWIFDGHTGAIAKKLPEAYFPAFSPDSHYLAAVSNSREVRIWETQSWRQVANFRVGNRGGLIGDDGRRIAFSPDSKTLIAGFDHQVKLWTAANNQVATFITTPKTVWDCGFSPDGHYLVTAEQEDGNLYQIWDTASGNAVSSVWNLGFPCYPSISTDGSRALCAEMILDFPSLAPLTQCSSTWVTGNPNAWLPGRAVFLTTTVSASPVTRLYERRRPEAAYGLLWLPQAWALLLGIGASGWLIRRDLRRWRGNHGAA